jgi:hypothetical protein
MLFSFSWKNPDGTWSKDPMHGEPLQLVPEEHRPRLLAMINENLLRKLDTRTMIASRGDRLPVQPVRVQGPAWPGTTATGLRCCGTR